VEVCENFVKQKKCSQDLLETVTSDGLEEYLVEEILDSRRRRKGWQYLVRWTGYGQEHDRWLTGSALQECAALDQWLDKEADTGIATQ